LAYPAPGFAQRPEGRPDAAPKSETPRAHVRPNNPDRSQNIEFLFGALKSAPDSASAKLVENRIQALWLNSGSDTADLLMNRAKTAAESNDLDLAIKLLDTVVELRPEFAEGWNRRATLYFLKKDYGAAIADIRQVLAREPRHFGAMAGLGMILNEIGDEKHALQVFRRALEIYPQLPRIPELIKQLAPQVDGRDI
jgi:tetratricopeptide (TPR) repeat protein